MTEAPATPATPRSRRGLYIPLVLLALVCLGWTGFWFYAKSRAIEIMDAWMTRESRLGRHWTCPERAIGGFPFRFEVTCANPTYTSDQPSRQGKGTLAGLTVTARVVDPRQVIAAFTAPLKWTGEAGDSVDVTFASARASYRGSGRQLDDLSIEFDKPSFTYTVPGLPQQTVAAARSDFHLRQAPGSDPATDLALSATALRSDALNQLMKDEAPGNLTFRTRLTKLLPSPPKDWRETADLWRLAEGEAKVETLSFAKGQVALNLTGVLRLDELRRPEGEITGTAQGIAALMQAFGLSMGGNTGAAGGLLGTLLSGGKPQSQGQPKALPFALRFDQGRMYIGPFPGPRLRPLY